MALIDRRRVRFALLPTEEGGRRAPVRSGYRPGFWLGRSTGHMPMLHDAAVTLLGTQALRPGETGDAELAPVVDEAWMRVANGQTLPCYEGSRLIGDAIVTVDGPLRNGLSSAIRELPAERFERLVSVLVSVLEHTKRQQIDDRNGLGFVVSRDGSLTAYQVRPGRSGRSVGNLQDTISMLADTPGVDSLRVVSQFDPPAIALHQMRSVSSHLEVEAAWYTPDWIVDQLHATPEVRTYFLGHGRDIVLEQLQSLRAARGRGRFGRKAAATAMRVLNEHDPFRIWALPAPANHLQEWITARERYPGAAEDAEQEGLVG